MTTWKIKILKLKKTSGDTIILHISTINDNHIMYGSGDMEGDRHNFFDILDHFVPFYPPPMVPENQGFEKMKKILKILSFYKCVP